MPSNVGAVIAEVDDGRFTVGGVRRLRAILADELPSFDEWDPWSAAPAAGAERPQVLLEVISEFCRSDPGVPEPARAVLAQASDHLYPQWWQVRDDLVRLRVPDLGAGQEFPDFLEAYLGWCLTVLWVFLELADQVRLAAAQPPPWLEADRSGATSGPPLRPPGTVA